MTRVLLVEDDEKLGRQVAEGLRAAGFDAVWARRGDEALAADFASFALVILDLMLPGMSGADLLLRIRQDARLAGVRVVMTTGATGVRARAGSADAILMKPFGVRELLAALKKVGVGAP